MIEWILKIQGLRNSGAISLIATYFRSQINRGFRHSWFLTFQEWNSICEMVSEIYEIVYGIWIYGNEVVYMVKWNIWWSGIYDSEYTRYEIVSLK